MLENGVLRLARYGTSRSEPLIKYCQGGWDRMSMWDVWKKEKYLQSFDAEIWIKDADATSFRTLQLFQNHLTVGWCITICVSKINTSWLTEPIKTTSLEMRRRAVCELVTHFTARRWQLGSCQHGMARPHIEDGRSSVHLYRSKAKWCSPWFRPRRPRGWVVV